jgi:hypothetical protein
LQLLLVGWCDPGAFEEQLRNGRIASGGPGGTGIDEFVLIEEAAL